MGDHAGILGAVVFAVYLLLTRLTYPLSPYLLTYLLTYSLTHLLTYLLTYLLHGLLTYWFNPYALIVRVDNKERFICFYTTDLY